MASTESTKPSSPASHGSATSSTTTVAPERGEVRGAGGRAARRAAATSPIAAARTTLGDGCTTSTIAAIAATVRPRPRPAGAGGPRTSSASTRAATSEKCAPDTAVTWVSPAARRAPARSSGIAAVSPTVTPGSNAPASPGSARGERPRHRPGTVAAAASGAGGADTHVRRSAAQQDARRSACPPRPGAAARRRAPGRPWARPPTTTVRGRAPAPWRRTRGPGG